MHLEANHYKFMKTILMKFIIQTYRREKKITKKLFADEVKKFQ